MIRKDFYYCHYCKDNVKQIENYESAIVDNTNTWKCHHKLETHTSDGQRRLVDLSKKELIALEMYYNRPSEELIFLRQTDHKKLHNEQQKLSTYNGEQCKKVKCIETDVIYYSIKAAGRINNLCHRDIRRCCKGERKTCGGFHWKYI